MRNLWSEIGALRVVLLAFTVLLLPTVWLSDMRPEGGGVLFAYIAPTLVILMFFVLLLDALMNRVFMAEQEEAPRQRARRRLRADLLAIALLCLFWGPYYYHLIALYAES